MNRFAAAVLLVVAASALQAQEEESPDCGRCGNKTYGTSVEWAADPSEAAKLAKEQEKLVFVLHVSGLFEDPKFT